ncbi:zinc protease [Fibrobacter sp. UWB16]|jgi:zinc protease|uniref:M16 family metallopeptidase n=1 Tax=unclassified Fibrobacter TaxID=2634177 RepID=UPI000B5251EC|nr:MULTISPECIES: pitrilysin family protein [unclassified Fibrobacter]OWV17117.1 peptidase M16 [Fibrobacter sp. UWB3]SOD13161.1 zinc protease [Fibrobacter sp. UWB16]
MKTNYMIPAAAFAALVALTSCSMMPKKTSHVKHTPDMYATAAESSSSVLPAGSNLPEHYSKIEFPEYKYVAPYPKDFRVQIADGITGYIVSDRSLPLVDFTVYFEESNLPQVLKDEAAFEMVGSMIRRGSGGGITPHVLEDSLEFVSASISTSVGTFLSAFDINCLSAYFPSMLELSKKVLTDPSFDKNQLEIVKANYVTAYERRFETPAKVLSALKSKVNYAPNPRLWDANAAEYKAVTAADVKRLAKGVFSSKRIVFALAGDVDKDSAVVALKKFFADWKVEPAKTEKPKPTPLTFARKPGVYVVDKDITQANITMNQPFVKRPHPDYYPTAVASFILGGGSFSSRLMNRVRSDEGLAYSVYSTVGNDYRDTAMTTIALQTKVETVDYAMKLIFEEVEKLAKDGPTAEELSQAKKSLVESLPSLFDSPASTASIFAKGELLGKSDNHYIDYVTEINAVTAEQVKAMIAKYFDREKMTISIVGPVAMFDSLKPFTVIPLDSLEFR